VVWDPVNLALMERMPAKESIAKGASSEFLVDRL
jgi:hypothetical protein